MGNRKEIHFNFYSMLLTLSILNVSNCGRSIDLKTSKSVADEHLSFLSIFHECLLHIMNYKNYNINLDALGQPVLLLSYDSLPNLLILVSKKLLKDENDDLIKVFSGRGKGLSLALAKKIVEGGKYTKQLFQESFRLSSRRTFCNVFVYLHPPNQDANPQLYMRSSWSTNAILKDPIWIHFLKVQHQLSYLGTIPQVSLLICEQDVTSSCNNDNHKRAWISTVLQNGFVVRFLEIVLILESRSDDNTLSILCPYCNRCNPLQMIEVLQTVTDFSTLLSYYEIISGQSYPRYIMTALHYSDLKLYGEMVLDNAIRNRKALINLLANFDITQSTEFLIYAHEVHLTQIFLPQNSTMMYTIYPGIEASMELELSIDGCRKPVLYPPKFRPFLLRDTNFHLGSFQEIGLVVQSRQLRFVSCHKKRQHSINRLTELVFAFDVYTWMLIFVELGMIAKISSLISNSQKYRNRISVHNSFASLIVSMIEQSTSIFQTKELSRRILLFSLPLTFFLLSNVYKGDNITNLTVDPKLVPFDTFDSLVENKFVIRSRRIPLNQQSLDSLRKNVFNLTLYVQENDHEAFPVVSELWHELLLSLIVPEFNRLAVLKDRFSERARYYLKHSKMIPTSTTESGKPVLQKNNYMNHMLRCKKSAIILPQNVALKVFTRFVAAKKPVYFGKEIISESLLGFKYFGFFPQKLLLRFRYSFHTGISEWWQKYIRWLVVLKTNNVYGSGNLSEFSGTLTNNNKSGVYILSLIPAFGFLLSLTIFICYDKDAFRSIMYGLCFFVKLVYRAKFWQKLNIFKHY